MELGKRIATLRTRLGINQSELARRVSRIAGLKPPMSPQSVQAWEKGGGIRPDKFEAIAEALEISLGELLLGDVFSVSQPARLDPATVVNATQALKIVLGRRGITYDPIEHATTFAAVYQEAATLSETPSVEQSIRFADTVAEIVNAQVGAKR